MALWSYAVVTNDGLALQLKRGLNNTMVFTKVKTSSASVSPVLLQAQTDVANKKQECLFKNTPYYIKSDGTVELSFIITNEDVTQTYGCWQVGIYAQDPDKGEILYAILQTENEMDVPAVGVAPGWSAEFEVALKIGNTENISVTVDATTGISKDEADARYLQKSEADTIYLKQTTADNRYLQQTTADNRYLQQTTADNRYLKKTDLTMKVKSVTIPNTGWAEYSTPAWSEYEEDGTLYIYRYNIKDSDITANCSVTINLDISSLIVAESCGLMSVTESYNGGVYVYGNYMPATNLNGTMVIQKGV